MRIIKKFIPDFIFNRLSPTYHWLLAFVAAVVYRFPSRRITVVGVTGTKGKTSVLEILSAILEEAGYSTAIASTLRFKIGKKSQRNTLKMTMPGRFFLQKFLRQAIKNKCQYALVEMSSQGALQFRHKFIEMDALIFTNLSPEHIEAHGTFEKYKQAKAELFKALGLSKKEKKSVVLNVDDENAEYFSCFGADEILGYGLKFHGEGLKVSSYKLSPYGIDFVIDGKEITSKLLGEFNLYNILAAVAFARSRAIEWEVIKRALEKFSGVPGRVEFIENRQGFKILVDYAHTSDSLEKLYKIFEDFRKICVLGATGGGRDKWKRKEMGRIAATSCDEIILTNEDPYDENPTAIIHDVAQGITSPFKYKMIRDRREAIREALKMAKTGDVVLITGKGTDPFIMGPEGSKIKWDDRDVVREELARLRMI